MEWPCSSRLVETVKIKKDQLAHTNLFIPYSHEPFF